MVTDYNSNLRPSNVVAEGRGFEDNEHAQSAAADEHVKQSHPQDSPTPSTYTQKNTVQL